MVMGVSQTSRAPSSNSRSDTYGNASGLMSSMFVSTRLSDDAARGSAASPIRNATTFG